jgi:hypothetical protein
MPRQNRTTTLARAQQAIDGITKNVLTMPTLPVGAKAYSPAQLAALIQSRIDAANEVAARKASWQAAVTTERQLDKQVTVALQDLRNLVIGAFGPTAPELASFGFSPPKVATLTTEQKQAAVLKRNATRVARRTMGKRQKAKIKGGVPAVAAEAASTTEG